MNTMNVHLWVWFATIGGLLVLLALDLWFVDRKPHEITVREASLWTVGTVALSVLFGLVLSATAGGTAGTQFFAGWITEYSLSADNLFVFVIIMARFSVPRAHQHRVLSAGVLIALVLRGAFIVVGAAAISRFDWIFYLFGAFLVYTAVKLARQHGGPAPEQEGAGPAKENPVVRAVQRFAPTTDHYDGARLTTRIGGRRHLTPMLLVIAAIGTTDLLFALDSIPAVFGLTQEPYLVFTANMFALLGLRQLYFLIDGLLGRLVYLSAGLSVILGFIGVKMIFEALHGSQIHAVGPVTVPHIGTAVSLAVILGTLAVTTVASLLRSRTVNPPAPAGKEQHDVERTSPVDTEEHR